MTPLRPAARYQGAFNELRSTAAANGRALASAKGAGISTATKNHFLSTVLNPRHDDMVRDVFLTPLQKEVDANTHMFFLPIQASTLRDVKSIASLEKAMKRPLAYREGFKVEFNRLDLTNGKWVESSEQWPTFSAKFKITGPMRKAEDAGAPSPVVTFIQSLVNANKNGRSVVWPDGSQHAYIARSIEVTTSLDSQYQRLFNKPTIEAFEHTQKLRRAPKK